MKDITDSILSVLKNRLINPIYGTFTISWVIFNWNFLYSIFALSQENIFLKTGMLKNEYLTDVYFNFYSFHFWLHLILPIILTFLIIYKFPRWFLLSAYKEEAIYKTNQAIVKLQQARKIREEETKIEQENAKELKAVAEQKQSEKIIDDTDPTIKWEREYSQLKGSKLFSHFRTFYEIIFDNRGSMYGEQSYTQARPLIAYLSSIGAVNLDSGIVELSEKGNYFMKRYLEETL